MSSPSRSGALSLDLERQPLKEKSKRTAAAGGGVTPFEIDDANSPVTTAAAAAASASSPPPTSSSPAAAAAAAAATGLTPYFKLLGTNAPFARLYAGELLNSAGQWFSYVSTLRIVNEASSGSGSASAIGVVVAIHYLPSFFLSPVAGVVADRLPREYVLAASSFAGAVAAALLGLVQARLGIPFFLLLLSLQYSASAFYDPARRAITPSLVNYVENDLVLATTLDTICWSTMTSIGASLGGVALSRLGAGWCFFLDSLTYLAATAAALSLRGHVKTKELERGGGASRRGPLPKGLPSRMRKAKTSFRGEVGGEENGREGEGESDSDSDEQHDGSRHRQQHALSSSSPVRGAAALLSEGNPPPASSPSTSSAAAAAAAGAAGTGAAAAPTSSSSSSSSPSSVAALAASALSAALADVKDGLRYAASHPHVLALTTLKLSGTLVWGAADVMNVKLSDTPSLAVAKKRRKENGDGSPAEIDSAATLGFIFAAVGVGAMLGSVASNALTSPDARSLLRSASAAFGLLTLGYAALSAAAAWSSLAAVLAATAARAAGSAVLWTYSTLLLQLEVPDALLGRTCALEQALYTLGECFSAVVAGLLFDAAAAAKAAAAKAARKVATATTEENVSVEAAAALMALIAGAFWAFWASYVRVHERKRSK